MEATFSTDRKYLKDAFPRFYEDLEDTLKCEWPEFLPQIPHLYLTGRCSCKDADYRTFNCESDHADYAPINGRRPFSYALNRVNGWYAVSADGIMSGFEILEDYFNGSLEDGLTAAGMPSPLKSA